MQYIESEYRTAVKELLNDERILFEDVKGTKRLNDFSVLYLPDQRVNR